MKPDFVSSVLWPLCLVLLGGFFIYSTVRAFDYYLLTGIIKYGRANHTLEGLPAAAAYFLWGLMGVYCAAQGVRQWIHGPDKPTLPPDDH